MTGGPKNAKRMLTTSLTLLCAQLYSPAFHVCDKKDQVIGAACVDRAERTIVPFLVVQVRTEQKPPAEGAATERADIVRPRGTSA